MRYVAICHSLQLEQVAPMYFSLVVVCIKAFPLHQAVYLDRESVTDWTDKFNDLPAILYNAFVTYTACLQK